MIASDLCAFLIIVVFFLGYWMGKQDGWVTCHRKHVLPPELSDEWMEEEDK